MKDKMKVFISSRSFGVACPEAIEIIKSIAEIERSTFGRKLNEKELMDIVPYYDGIIVGMDEVTEKVIYSSNKLKVIAKHGIGLDNIDLNAATKHGVIVTFVPQENAESVADFTFCLILALARKIINAHLSTIKGEWSPLKFVGKEIYGKTLGIIGLGSIGLRVAKRAKGFDMRILCTTAHPEKHKKEAEIYGIEFVNLETLLKESDIITIHVPLTPETKGMIGSKELSLMKKDALLINTARGPIIDEKALIEALKEKKIAGAALDVFEKEPPDKDNPLFKLENVIVAPHMASYTIEALSRVDLTLAQDLVKALKGEKPKYIANPQVFEK